MSYAIKGLNGEFFVYCRDDGRCIFTSDIRFVRQYTTRRGARIACGLYKGKRGTDFMTVESLNGEQVELIEKPKRSRRKKAEADVASVQA
jgi:hypothetical protein